MTNFNWKIRSMECKLSEGELQDVVSLVKWKYIATETIGGNDYSAETLGITEVNSPSGVDFTPYADLTKEQVTGWLESILDIPEMQLMLQDKINTQVNPVYVTSPLPFDNN